MNRREFIVACGGAGCLCVLSRVGFAGEKKTDAKMEMAACGLDCNTCGTRSKGCEGCHGPDDKVWSTDCSIRACCIKRKEKSNCSECDHFPCEAIEAFENDKYPHHRKAIENLRKIREENKNAKQ